MSEYFSEQDREEKLKGIIKRLHEGEAVDAVKKDFHKLIKKVSPEEIAKMEQALIAEGLPLEEIQRLCEVHVEVFEKSLAKQKRAAKLAGHPIHTFMMENNEIKNRIRLMKKTLDRIKKQKHGEEIYKELKDQFAAFKAIELHYQRKENQLFPYLEQKGFTGPSKVMWAKHNEIRSKIKECKELLSSEPGSSIKSFYPLFTAIQKMIFMEEKILFPTALKKITEREWAMIRKGEQEIGYAWITPGNLWDADIVLQKSMDDTLEKTAINNPQSGGEINLEVGRLSQDRINLMLKNLPFDVTYVDEHDKVLYYTGSQERIFPRSPGIIGRNVQNCHPQKSVHIVNQILDAFREKKRKVAEFWINMNGRFIYIRYLPLYDSKGIYKGVIEVTQDVTAIRKLDGEKRLLDWK